VKGAQLRDNGASKEQLPTTPALRDAVLALKSLRKAYVSIFRDGKKHGRRWDRCDEAYARVLLALQDERVIAIVDERVDKLHVAGNSAPEHGLRILNETYIGRGHLERLERRLGHGAGFSNTELRRLLGNARDCLKDADRKTRLPHVVDTNGLVQHLRDIHAHAEEVLFQSSSKHPIKTAERRHARTEINGRLYLVISVVANSDYRNLFPTSYVSGLGAAGYRQRKRKALPIQARSLPPGIPTPAPS
jgi:hypothetical protein